VKAFMRVFRFRSEAAWQILPTGVCAPLSAAADLLGDTDALLDDVRLLLQQSRELIAESRKIVSVSHTQTRPCAPGFKAP
jgi:hypothetical protein